MIEIKKNVVVMVTARRGEETMFAKDRKKQKYV